MEGFISSFITDFKGGPGSGHWGHAGVPGQHGGSAPGKKRAHVSQKYEHLEKEADQWFAGLTATQKQALYSWGGSSAYFRLIQQGGVENYLKDRGSKFDVEWAQGLYPHLMEALKTAPKYKGVVYRGLGNVPGEVIGNWVQSGEITLDSMQSSSASQTTANKWAHRLYASSGGVLLRISQKSGVLVGSNTNVTEWSSGMDDYTHTDEQEVILPKGAQYRIRSVSVFSKDPKQKRIARSSLAEVVAREVADWETSEKTHDFERMSGARYMVKTGRKYGPAEIEEKKPYKDPSWRAAWKLAGMYYKLRKAQIIKEIKAGQWPDPARWRNIPFAVIDVEEIGNASF